MSVHAGAAAAQEPERPVDGRYRIEGEIARGAMGAVYRVFDLSTTRRLALKRSLSRDPKHVRMFEREYHTLVGLKHPRIIEVYDYGIDEQGPYYTMELLDGRDLRELAPLDYREACRYLREVASSLGLLHARRLLHRDLSPRNVRVTSSGGCKLIDFGGLSAFGVPDMVVGTPPCVPPEALHHAPLDQRSDLYSLGALAYWTLTGRHAYPARELHTLPAAFRITPLKPSEVVAQLDRVNVSPVPAELDDLVMSLLTLDPLGRPASAAEVIDRLIKIADLPREADAGVTTSYLIGVESVGRRRERERLRKRLSDTLRGRGSSVVVDARSGMGGTRLLAELAVDAQLGGALPIVLDAAARRGSYGVIHDLVDRLLSGAREDAIAAAAGHEALLSRFSPLLEQALGSRPDASDLSAMPGELRRRMQGALSRWLEAVARRRPLLVAVDNAHRIDDASASLLATLASESAAHPILIVACLKTDQLGDASPGLRALQQAGSRMALRGLGRDEVHTLVKLWFGNVENTGRLSDWLYRISGGNPRTCAELAEHLVRSKVIRYIHGSWVLPQELLAGELPASVDEMQLARVEALSEAARRLAEALSVHRGQVPLERCLAMADADAISEPFAVLDALTRENVLVSVADAYAFSHDGLRDAVLARIEPARRRQLHLRMGALIEASMKQDDASALDAGWHLLHGGEEERGARLLADAGLRLSYSADDLATAVPALRAALEVYRRLGRSDFERARLLGPLGMAGYFADRRLADELGEEVLSTFERLIGLHLCRRLRPWLGLRLAFFASLGLSAVRHLLRPGGGGVGGFRALVTQYISCATVLTGVAAICLDSARGRAVADRVAPLILLGADNGARYAHRFITMLSMLPEERITDVIAGCREVLARLEDPRPIPDLPPEPRVVLHSGVLYALGSMEVFCADSKTLAIADNLQKRGMKLDELVADQLRTTYHAMRGEVALSETYRARVEMHAVQAGTAWQVEMWVPSFLIMVYVSTLDTIGLKRTMEQLDRIAKEVPSFVIHARLARAEYHHLKGEHTQGFELAQPVLDGSPDRSFLGRTFAVANHARALNRIGRHAEAIALVTPLIARLSADDERVAVVFANLHRERAHGLCGLGRHTEAFAIIDGQLARYADSGHPLLLGNLHATAAAIAMAAGDPARGLEHVSHMQHWFRPTGNPALIAQCERMLRETRRLVDGVGPAAEGLPAVDTAIEDASESPQSARSLLSQCHGGDQRAEFALRLVLTHVRGRTGFLFGLGDGGALSLIAPLHGEEPPAGLVLRVRADLAGAGEEEEATVVTEGSSLASLPPPMPTAPSEQSYRIYPLTIPGASELRVVGAIAVQSGDRALRSPQQAFLQAVARSLFEGADAGVDTRVG